MSQIHIANGETDTLIGHISFDYLLYNDHARSKPDNSETFNFTTFSDQAFSEHLSKRNRIIIPGEDNEFREFIIFEAYEDRITKQVEVYTKASYLDLKKAKKIDPHKTTAESAERHAQLALSGTEWKVGNVVFKGVRTIQFEDYTNPYDYLKRVSSEFDLELDFRIEHDGSKIIGRYVDLVEQVGTWRGRIVEFGRDLLELKRIENTNNIVTALYGIGPEKEDGTRLEVFVEDMEALARWGRNGEHLVDVYEPVSSDSEMTKERLTELTKNELEKRINAVVSYIGGIADLENIEGMENKKIRFGDTIQIKDTHYNPPLYLEARIYKQNRDITVKGRKQVELGDYVEYTKEEADKIWKSLQQEIITIKGETEVALRTANDKNSVFFQDTAPDEAKVNDIWFDTQSGNKMHRFNGSEWVDEQYDYQALNVKKLSSIAEDLGVVKAGTLMGVYIEGGSIKSNTLIDVTTDLYVGNNIYLGKSDLTGNKTIDFFSGNSYISSAYRNVGGVTRNILSIVAAGTTGVVSIAGNEIQLSGTNVVSFIGQSSEASIDITGGDLRLRQSPDRYITVSKDGRFYMYNQNGLVFNLFDTESANHKFLRMGSVGLKFLNGSLPQVQVRNSTDTAYATIVASNVSANSTRESKLSINPYETEVWETMKNLQVYSFVRKENQYAPIEERYQIGHIYEELPVILTKNEGVEISSMLGFHSKVLQEIIARIENLEERERVNV